MLARQSLSPAGTARVIAAWLRSGLLVKTDYRDPVHRRSRKGVRGGRDAADRFQPKGPDG